MRDTKRPPGIAKRDAGVKFFCNQDSLNGHSGGKRGDLCFHKSWIYVPYSVEDKWHATCLILSVKENRFFGQSRVYVPVWIPAGGLDKHEKTPILRIKE